MNLRWSLENINEGYPDILQSVILPEGADKEIFIDTLLNEYGQFGISVPLLRFRRAVAVWSGRNAYSLKGLWETTRQKYSPIENYDRFEESTDNHTGSDSTTGKASATSTSTAKSSDTSTQTGSTEQTNKKSAYDSATYEPDTQANGLTDSTTTNEGNSSGSNNSTSTNEGSSTSKMDMKHTAHIHGNIGVTTAMQMLNEERAVVMFDFYHAAANMFANELLVGIYL